MKYGRIRFPEKGQRPGRPYRFTSTISSQAKSSVVWWIEIRESVGPWQRYVDCTANLSQIRDVHCRRCFAIGAPFRLDNTCSRFTLSPVSVLFDCLCCAGAFPGHLVV
nr:unnamed protein product [Callosobruchus analis]